MLCKRVPEHVPPVVRPGMAEQQFCLRWNHHHTTLINVFESLLKDESLVDVTLYAEGRYVKAHKVVLSACSQYFKVSWLSKLVIIGFLLTGKRFQDG